MGARLPNFADVKPAKVLTRRQRDVLPLVLAGKFNKEIADELCIGLRTVKFHVSNLLLFYEVRNRAQLLALHLDKKG